jgi:aldehyde dehydrogenase (NAD+)
MENIAELVNAQKFFFETGETKKLETRKGALKKLYSAIAKGEEALTAALKADLNKSAFDTYSTEIGIVLKEISFTLKHLSSWVKPQRVKTPITHLGTKGYILSEPYGIALVISPWNYPIQLSLMPLIGAIAAGNTVILKPSELTPYTSECLARIIKEEFAEEYIAVVQGDADTSTALLNEKVDYIFFTGGTAIGKVIMEAAAKHLTPVTLELGGKSPCIIHHDANIKLAAKRVAWGKFMNAGQTCVAPDYIYVHKDVKDSFLNALTVSIKALYGNHDYTKIVNERHFERLTSYLDDRKIVLGGTSNREERWIEPTIMANVTWEDPVMQGEIFGPILPVLEYNDLSTVIKEINNEPNPLAFYIFSENQQIQDQVIQNVSFGGGCINDTVYHMTSPYLPFGGVGNSGMGAHHGKHSFESFSHKKSVLKQTTLLDIPFRYPNSKNALKRIKQFLK